SFIGGNLEIALAANLTASSRLGQDTADIPRFSSGNCHFTHVNVKTNLPSSVLPKVMSKFINSNLQKVLPGLVSPVLFPSLFPGDHLLLLLLLTTLYRIPLGTAGTLQYTLLNPPTMNETFIELDLRTVLHEEEGKEVGLPMAQLSLSSLPPKRGAATQLTLSADLLSAELSVLQASFNLNISNNTGCELGRKVSVTLSFDSPQISGVLPPSQPVTIEMREAKAPVVTITPDKSFVQLFSTSEFWVSPSDSPPESLFVLDAHSNLEAEFAIAEEKLRLSLALQRWTGSDGQFTPFSVFQEMPLKGVLADIIHVAYVPSIN
ncbi:BPIB6 protein, partial [Thinocorus orbignyianus]|nr:BPIB6 protein [Thinocorus orbignyianus]